MVKLNANLKNLKKNYLFVDVQNKTKEYISENPNARLISMGIGDVTLPLSPVITKAMQDAATEMSDSKTFHGYGPYEGYEFLREAISKKYLDYGVKIKSEEVYVSDGAKSDSANILDILSPDSTVLITDPVYPVYLDSSIMGGYKIKYVDANKDNGFLPLPYEGLKADIIYLCSPNNPTGAVYNKTQLKKWVDFANDNNSLIIFDAAYEAFIEGNDLPHSIFEIEGSRKCAVELCSFSKSAGFTGIRCAYAVIPEELKVGSESLGKVWLRRQSIKFNGVSYITQKAALASLSPEGREETLKCINYYKRNARVLSGAIEKLGFWYTGGENSPYIWFKGPQGMNSWELFDCLLKKANIVSTPGSGFGSNGEGFIRLSSFGSYENTLCAAQRLSGLKF